MRLRFAVLASALIALAAMQVSTVSAAPHHNRGVTINATPNPVIAGGGVLIYGQLKGPNVARQTIRLYHHVNPTPGYRLIGTTKTNSLGFYEFSRQEGVVYSNRSWFVRGPRAVHSRTVHERVSALISVAASATNLDTRHAVLFSGHVTPNHAGQHVFLQEQKGSSDEWRTLKSGLLGPGSNYSIAYRWRVPNAHVVRVLLRADARNIRSVSDSVSITVQQAQVAGFTINSSSPVIPEGGSATISGVLDKAGTTTPDPSKSVSLWAHPAGQSHFTVLASTSTAGDGSYHFTVMPNHNELYQVRTSFAPRRHSAVLFEGVRDVVTLIPSSTTSQVGGHVTFTGVVTPEKTGRKIFLQQLGKDGDWHDVAATRVRPGSTYEFGWTFGEGGSHRFRTRMIGDQSNIGAVSPAVTVTVSGVASVTSLPPAS